MLCAGSVAANVPPETATVESVAKSCVEDVRYGVNEVGLVPLIIENDCETEAVPLFTATTTSLVPDLNAVT